MKITAFTTPGCFYCDQLKQLMERANLECEYITLVTEEEKHFFRHQYPRASGYPYVMFDGEHVGGLVETAAALLEKGLVSAPKK